MMTMLSRNRSTLLPCLAMVLLLGHAASLTAQQSAEPPGDPDPVEPPSSTGQETPSLDELLGIEESEEGGSNPESGSEVDAITENDRRKIDDRLNERDLEGEFTAAIKDMEVAATMLDSNQATGLDVQRLQKEIMARLDAVIAEASRQQQQQQQQQSSSSQQQQQQQQQQDSQGQVPQQPNQNQADQAGQSSPQPGDSKEELPPGRREAEFQVMFEESDAEWGSLPQRIRDLLRQGMRESVSRMYRGLTESYYRRIAEDASE